MSTWMHKVLTYLDQKGKDSYVQSDLDRLCLALTCKSLFKIIDCWPLAAELRNSTRARPRWIYDRYYPWEKAGRERWELLRRLENANWRRYMGCYKLHPVNEFSMLDLWTPADRRTCFFGKLVGVVRLCPCIEMTFRDKVRITKELIRLQQREQQPAAQPEGSNEAQRGDDHNKGFLLGFDPATGQHQCIHECNDHWRQSQRIKAQRNLKFGLDEEHNLVLETEYQVTDLQSIPGQSMGTQLLCPHIQVTKGIHNIIYVKRWPKALRIRSGRRMKLVQSYPGSFSCVWCLTTISNVQEKRYLDSFHPRDFTFSTRRCLGNAMEHADNIWYQQTETSIENQVWQQRRRNGYYTDSRVFHYHESI